MNDTISRNVAIEYLMTNMGWRDEDGYEVDDADEKRAIITDLVNGIPAVDAVPVVRCAGCKHWETDWTPKGTIQGFHFCPMVGFVTREDFYCANGERRDGDI